VPQAENVWFRPLCLNRSQGYWTNLLKVRKAGVLSRHRHPQPVHGFVLKGRWHYLEHDWVAEEGGYVYEPPGETHTLVVPDDVEEMITYFQVNGVMCYVDPWGKVTGYADVFTKIDLCRNVSLRPKGSLEVDLNPQGQADQQSSNGNGYILQGDRRQCRLCWIGAR
jgi:quercetin dioxygenase-like cupin family protein